MTILFLPFIIGVGIFCTALTQMNLALASLEAHKASWLRQSEAAFVQVLTEASETVGLSRYVTSTLTITTFTNVDNAILNTPVIVVSVKRSE